MEIQNWGVFLRTLHIVDDNYNGKNISPLSFLEDIVRSSENKKIHILSAYKSIIEALTSKETSPSWIGAIRDLKPNIIAGNTPDKFDENANNIGTSFKTGVNIKGDDCLLVILFLVLLLRIRIVTITMEYFQMEYLQ